MRIEAVFYSFQLRIDFLGEARFFGFALFYGILRNFPYFGVHGREPFVYLLVDGCFARLEILVDALFEFIERGGYIALGGSPERLGLHFCLLKRFLQRGNFGHEFFFERGAMGFKRLAELCKLLFERGALGLEFGSESS